MKTLECRRPKGGDRLLFPLLVVMRCVHPHEEQLGVLTCSAPADWLHVLNLREFAPHCARSGSPLS